MCAPWEVLTVSDREASSGSVLGTPAVLGQENPFSKDTYFSHSGGLEKAELLKLEVQRAASCVPSPASASMAKPRKEEEGLQKKALTVT